MHIHNKIKAKLLPLLEGNGAFLQSHENANVWQSEDITLKFSNSGSDDIELLRNEAFEKSSSLIGWDFDECLLINSEDISADWISAMQLAYVLEKNCNDFQISKSFCVIREDAKAFSDAYHLLLRRYDLSSPTWRFSYIYHEKTISCLVITSTSRMNLQLSLEHIYVDYDEDARMAKDTIIWSGKPTELDFTSLIGQVHDAESYLHDHDWATVTYECGWGSTMSRSQFLEDFFYGLESNKF